MTGLDPNVHPFLEFKIFERLSWVENDYFKLLCGDGLVIVSNDFDELFYLGVLYHIPDSIRMLRTIRHSIKKGLTLIIDCKGCLENNLAIGFIIRDRYI